MYKAASILLAILILLTGATYYYIDRLLPISAVYPTGQALIFLNNIPINVTVADTESLRTQGLSGREGLASDEGMLFIFPNDDQYGFWMKDMRFPIDIIWLSAEGQVVDVTEYATPESYPRVFAPLAPVRFVLEVPSGFVAEHHISTGSKMSF